MEILNNLQRQVYMEWVRDQEGAKISLFTLKHTVPVQLFNSRTMYISIVLSYLQLLKNMQGIDIHVPNKRVIESYEKAPHSEHNVHSS